MQPLELRDELPFVIVPPLQGCHSCAEPLHFPGFLIQFYVQNGNFTRCRRFPDFRQKFATVHQELSLRHDVHPDDYLCVFE